MLATFRPTYDQKKGIWKKLINFWHSKQKNLKAKYNRKKNVANAWYYASNDSNTSKIFQSQNTHIA